MGATGLIGICRLFPFNWVARRLANGCQEGIELAGSFGWVSTRGMWKGACSFGSVG